VDDRWIYAVLPFITIVALGVGFAVVFREGGGGRGGGAL
jgi:hypothetical protein